MTSAKHAYAEMARALVRSARMLDRVDSGLSLPQYRLLTLLDAGDERSTALAQRLAVSKPAISTAVETLSGLGHISRRADVGDRRASWLQITESGVEALRRADEAYGVRIESVVERMDDPAGFLAAFAEYAAQLDVDLAERRQPGKRLPTGSGSGSTGSGSGSTGSGNVEETITATKEAAPE